ncbi:MAG: hypothetical protein V4760_17500 [Bdellovibrionota bacterium]
MPSREKSPVIPYDASKRNEVSRRLAVRTSLPSMKPFALYFILLGLALPSCDVGFAPAPLAMQSRDGASSTPDPVADSPSTDSPTPPTPGTPPSSGTTFKALWSGKHPQADEWTADAQASLANFGDALLAGPTDVTDFCPRFSRLGTNERIDFFVQFIAAMTKYESSFNPALRFTETSMGNDPVTGVQVQSEGLMQLSYVDELNYRAVVPAGACDFDFQGDKRYTIKDLRRSILDPKKNLTCAIAILNRQVERYNKLAVSSGAYWAVIKTDRSTNKLPEIKAITKALPFCQ